MTTIEGEAMEPWAFAPRQTTEEIERGTEFQPRFDADGLIPAIVTDDVGGGVLMFAWMDRGALQATLETGEAHFWSRSRKRLWRKGEESGNTLTLVEMRTDCDQDVVWLRVLVNGAGVACHTGETSCFYRVLHVANPPDDPVRLTQPTDRD